MAARRNQGGRRDSEFKWKVYKSEKRDKRKEEKKKTKERELKEFREMLGNSMNQAVQRGIYELKRDNPGLASYDVLLDKHMNHYAIEDKARDLYAKHFGDFEQELEEGAEKVTISKAQLTARANYIADSLKDYVAMGEMLNEKGKKMLLTGHLKYEGEEAPKGIKGFFYKMRHKAKTDGQKKLNQKFDTFENWAAMIESGHSDDPEFTKLSNKLKNMRLYDASVEVLREGGIISAKNYGKFKGKVIHKTERGGKAIEKTLEKKLEDDLTEEEKGKDRTIDHYVFPQEEQRLGATGAILTFFGLGLILVKSQGITGNAINFSELISNTGSFLGVGTLILGIVLFLLSRKSFSKRIKRKEKCK